MAVHAKRGDIGKRHTRGGGVAPRRYTGHMKRLQIDLDDEVYEALAAAARREGLPKAALVGRYVRERLACELLKSDPLDSLVGRYDEVPGTIDDIVYGT